MLFQLTIHSRKTNPTDILLQPQNSKHSAIIHLHLQTNQTQAISLIHKHTHCICLTTACTSMDRGYNIW